MSKLRTTALCLIAAMAAGAFAGRARAAVYYVDDDAPVDSDGDGVPDECDACPTVAGAAVDESGCSVPIFGDFDRDGDVDTEDFGAFQVCLTGDHVPQILVECFPALMDADDDVDDADTSVFAACLSGPGVAADVGCHR